MNLEYAEKIAAKPLFVLAFNIILAALWIIINTDVANIFISIITAEIVLLGLGAQRRSNLALHAKLDELIRVTADARDELEQIEENDEDTILEVRKSK